MTQAIPLLYKLLEYLHMMEHTFTHVNEEASAFVNSIILHLNTNQKLQKEIVLYKECIYARILDPQCRKVLAAFIPVQQWMPHFISNI